jgi:UrcA family protein
MKNRYLTSAIGCFLVGAMAATPVIAQSAPEEIIVTGRYGKVPDSVQSLSQTVSYADLDLSTAAGKALLRKRLSLTARFLCQKLGETDTSTPLVPSCRAAAVEDAMSRVGKVEASFAPRGTTWVAGPAWQAPYPAEWDTRYAE